MIALTVRTGGALPSHRTSTSAPYRRQGIALRLVREAEAWTREQGMLRLATDVAEGNHAALAFFLRAGYYEERGMLEKISANGQSVRT